MPSETPRAPVSGDAIVVDGDMLDTAVIELFRNLRKTVNDKPKPEMNEALAEQRRCIRVLQAVDKFIEQTWCDTDASPVRRYLSEVANRLDMLNDGTVHWMFVPLAKRGGQLDPVEVWEGREWACAAIECHVRSRKYKLNAAAELVAQRPALKRLMRGVSEEKLRKISKKQLTRSLLSWRRQFQQGRANMIVQDQWRCLLLALDNTPGGTPEQLTAMADRFLGLAISAADRVILPKKVR